MSDSGSTNGRTASGSDLLAYVEHDLAGCRVERRSRSVALVRPPGGPTFEVEVRRERRKLIDLQVLAVHVRGADTPAGGAAIILHHRGHVRRTGLTARVRDDRDGRAAMLRDRLLADGELERAVQPLDFTRFQVHCREGSWTATLELMGGSYVRTLFPPSARYIRLDRDQRDALLGSVAVIHARMPGREPAAVRRTPERAPQRRSDHLPRRPRSG